MKKNNLPFNLLLLLAAVSVGYLGSAAVRALLGTDKLPEVRHEAPLAAVVDAEELLARSAQGADIPPEVMARMLGQKPPPAKVRPRIHEPRIENPYAFAVGEHVREQTDAMKQDLLTRPDLQQQEDGVTVESIEIMAREGRMAW